MFRRIDDSVSVAPQVMPSDMTEAAAQGFRFVINNRPDGEEPGQPTGAEIEAAARAAGLGYVAIPVGHGGFRPDQVAAMADALDAAPGRTLAFCRSGTRSTFLWALARGKAGDDPDTIAARAAAAGYDIGAIRPLLRRA